MRRTKEDLKKSFELFKSVIFWALLIAVIVGFARGFRTIFVTKWGYFSYDWIPYIIILCGLGYWNILSRINKLENQKRLK